MDIDVEAAASLVFTPVNDAELDVCDYDDVIEVKMAEGKTICKGMGCVDAKGVDVRLIRTAKIVLFTNSDCLFYWQVTGKAYIVIANTDAVGIVTTLFVLECTQCWQVYYGIHRVHFI